jgi:dienelactone hydrolase
VKQLLSALTVLSLAMCSGAERPVGGPVVIDTEGARLAGTIYLPEDAHPPVAAAVLVHGSGRTTREDMRGVRAHLNAMGVAVLAYDKRGVGESTGEYDNVGVRTSPERMPLLGRDALAALRILEGRPGFDRTRLGFVGVSQAGWIIPSAMAAARSGEVRFAVIQSGPAGSVGQEYAYSEATGDGFRPHEALTTAEIDARVDAYSGPPGFDNLPSLRVDRIPILWLLGEDDESIPVRHTTRNLQQLARDGVPITIRTYPGANHALFVASRPVGFWADVRTWLEDQGVIPRAPHTTK